MEVFTLFSGSALSMNLAGAVNSLAVGLGVLALLRRLVRRQPFAGSLRPVAPMRSSWRSACLFHSGFHRPRGERQGVGTPCQRAGCLPDGGRCGSTMSAARRRFIVMLFVSVPHAFGCGTGTTVDGKRLTSSWGFIGTEFAYRPAGHLRPPGCIGLLTWSSALSAIGLYFSVGVWQSTSGVGSLGLQSLRVCLILDPGPRAGGLGNGGCHSDPGGSEALGGLATACLGSWRCSCWLVCLLLRGAA